MQKFEELKKSRVWSLVGKTMKWSFIVFCVYLGSLGFRQERLPAWVVNDICDYFSVSNTVVSIGEISFGVPRGLCLERLKVFDKSRKDPLEPVFAADAVQLMPMRSKVRIDGAKLTRLHDGYYVVGSKTYPPGPNDGSLVFPRLPDFDLELVRPEILGVKPESVTARVVTTRGCMDVRGIHLIWPDVDAVMALDGYCTIDLAAMRLHGMVEGLAKQAHIRPMLGDYDKAVTLDVPVALPYMDAFTEVVKPVPASCAWDVDLATCEFTIRIRLNPELGKYNGVALKQATGGVTVHVWWKNGDMQYATSVDVDSSCDHRGHKFGGHLTVWGTNDVRVVVMDAASGLRKQDTLDILGYLNDGMLDDFECVRPPQVAVRGSLATRPTDMYLNDMHGAMRCEEMKVFGVAVSNVTTKFDYVGSVVKFSDVKAEGRTGGRIGCNTAIWVVTNETDAATYKMDLQYRDGSMEEVSDIFKFDLGKKCGKVEGDIHLEGEVGTNALRTLCGKGHVHSKDGHIAQMKLFAGMTELLADKVPGVGAIVNQSDASADFTIANGVVRSDNIRIEGALFSISAEGSYDMIGDELDFVVRVRFMKDDSVPGVKELVRVLSWPFSKLLMEFRVKGKVDEPKWEYVSLLDRVM